MINNDIYLSDFEDEDINNDSKNKSNNNIYL